jgi:hypothetical protein
MNRLGIIIAAIFCIASPVSAQVAESPAAVTPVDINAIKPGETYRWGNGNYLENKGDCRFDIGGQTWGPSNFKAPTGRGVHRVNSRQNYTADCIGGNIKLTLIDR